jgi:hypothetical protein
MKTGACGRQYELILLVSRDLRSYSEFPVNWFILNEWAQFLLQKEKTLKCFSLSDILPQLSHGRKMHSYNGM